MEWLHPGVYVEEIPSAVKPIEAVSTSTAAFIGRAEKGRTDEALLVTNFTEFQKEFGGFIKDYWLAYSAYGFFKNGGRRLYVVRASRGAKTAELSCNDVKVKPSPTLSIKAISPGEWGNKIRVDIEHNDKEPNLFDLRIKLMIKSEIADDGSETCEAEEYYNGLSMNPDLTNYVETRINGISGLINVTVNQKNDSKTAGKSESGVNPATSISDKKRKMQISVDNDGFQTIELEDDLNTTEAIVTALKLAIQNLRPLRSLSHDLYLSVNVEFSQDQKYIITSPTEGKCSQVEILDYDNPDENAAEVLKLGRDRGKETWGSAELRPEVVTDKPLKEGNDGMEPQDSDYVSALKILDKIKNINIVAVPGIFSVAGDGITHCRSRKDCFFIADMDPKLDDPTEIEKAANEYNIRSSYGALYYPWIKATDPLGKSSKAIPLPPSGFVAGLYARIDNNRGIWKAPAGTEAMILGANGLCREFTDRDQDILNPKGINLIRSFPGAGIVIWGARTMAGTGEPEYRYIPIRRISIFIKESLYYGLQWVVFEPNDEPLWSQIRLNVGAFMGNLYRQGAFQGSTPREAFFVKCDNETTSDSDRDAGRVNILVGFAPLKPAEFVVVKITQMAGQTYRS